MIKTNGKKLKPSKNKSRKQENRHKLIRNVGEHQKSIVSGVDDSAVVKSEGAPAFHARGHKIQWAVTQSLSFLRPIEWFFTQKGR